MTDPAGGPQARTGRSLPSARLAAVIAILTGSAFVVLYLPRAWAPLAAGLAGAQPVLLADDGASGLVFGLTVVALGLFTLWSCRKPRSTDFKATAFALWALLWPVVVFGAPLPYGPLCRWWLQGHGYERCNPAEVGQVYAIRSRGGRVPLTTYAHRPAGGCAALPRPGSRLLPPPGPAIPP